MNDARFNSFNIHHSTSRVAITGIGIISPIGRGQAATLEALRAGRSGIRQITSIDTSELNCRIGGEVPAGDHEGQHRGFDRFSRFALIAAEEATKQANYAAIGIEPTRIGSLIGTGLGGCETLDDGYRRIFKNSQRIPPASIAASMYNAAASAVSTTFGAKGRPTPSSRPARRARMQSGSPIRPFAAARPMRCSPAAPTHH